MSAAYGGSPWAEEAPQPTPLTRDDRVLAAAHASHARALSQGDEHLAWEQMPARIREEYVLDAAAALDSAYPLLESAEELDALQMGDVLIGPGGVAWERVITPNNNLVRNPERCWAQQAWAGTRTRISSAELAANGATYVLVHRTAVASWPA